jgi:hypothetical protein
LKSRLRAGGAGAIVAVAGFGLPGAPAPPSEPLVPEDWQALLLGVIHERIEGLLSAAVTSGAWPVTEGQLDDVRASARARAKVDLYLEHELLLVTRMLEDAGVACRVLKGQAWAHSVYPDPSWRGFGDIDLLVRDDDWYAVIDLLEAAGGRRRLPELRPGFDRRFGKDATLVLTSGWQVDLHRTLVVGPFGLWIDERDMFDRPVSLIIGGVNVATLNPEASFLHACYNAALADDPPRLIAVRDVCQVASFGVADPGLVEEMARRWRATSVISRALSLAADMVGHELWRLPVPAPLATKHGSAFERTLVATYRGAGRGYTSQLATLAALPGVRERLAYLFALARPQSPYLAARGSSPLTHARTAVRRTWEGR